MLKTKICLLGTALALSSMFARGAGKPGEIPFKLVQGFGIVVRCKARLVISPECRSKLLRASSMD